MFEVNQGLLERVFMIEGQFGDVLTSSLGEAVASYTIPQNGNRKTRLAYITSPRELEKEGVGSDDRITPTLEFLANQIKAGNRYVSGIEIVAVVVDDNGQASPGSGQRSAAFEYLRSFCEQNGIAFHIEESKPWRSIKGDPDAKGEAKRAYEQRLLNLMRKNGVDVILSDSYVVMFGETMLDSRNGYGGLMVNIHPGIVGEVPGVHPTRDALVRARMFTSDPDERSAISAQLRETMAGMIELRQNGQMGSLNNILGEMGVPFTLGDEMVAIPRVPNIFRATTGASLHVVNEVRDRGRPILVSTGTPILERHTEQGLRVDNYPTKNNTTLRGLGMFAREQRTRDLISENRVRNRNFSRELPFRAELPQPTQRSNARAPAPRLLR